MTPTLKEIFKGIIKRNAVIVHQRVREAVLTKNPVRVCSSDF